METYLRVELFVLVTANHKLVCVSASLDDAIEAADDDNGGYIPHYREVYADSDDLKLNPVPLRRNYIGDNTPAYYIYKIEHFAKLGESDS